MPVIESMTCQLDLPTQNGRMARSLAELSMGTSPSSRKVLRYFSWFMLYRKPSFVFSLSTVSELIYFTHAKYASTSGFMCSWRRLRRSVGVRLFHSSSNAYMVPIRSNAWYAIVFFMRCLEGPPFLRSFTASAKSRRA